MKVIERVLEEGILCKLRHAVWFHASKGIAIFFMRQVWERHQARKKRLCYAFVDLEKSFDRVLWEVVRWPLRKLCVDGCEFAQLCHCTQKLAL